MSSTFCGSVFAGLTAFFIGVIGCFDASSQEPTKPAEGRIETEPVLAGEEQPERSEESQPQQDELGGEKPGEEVVEIPLDQIWTYRMPGTRSIRKLDPDAYRRGGDLPPEQQIKLLRNSKIERILNSLNEPLPDEAKPQKAFAVLGTGREALDRAADVLLEVKKPDKEFSSGSDVSVIFFTRRSTLYVYLERITVRNLEIELQYRVVPHLSLDVTNDLAIIPFKDLPSGHYTVRILPPIVDDKFETLGVGEFNPNFVKRYIPESFSFTIR